MRLRLGDFDGAEKAVTEAVHAAEDAWWSGHPYGILPAQKLATVKMYRGEFAEAEMIHRWSVEVLRGVLPADDQTLRNARFEYAQFLDMMRRYPEAEAMLNAASSDTEEPVERRIGFLLRAADHFQCAKASSKSLEMTTAAAKIAATEKLSEELQVRVSAAHANALRIDGKYADAEREFEAVAKAMENDPAISHSMQYVLTMNHRAGNLIKLGKLEAAEACIAAAGKVLSENFDTGNMGFAALQTRLAELRDGQGRGKEAVELYLWAISNLESHTNIDFSSAVVDTLTAYASLQKRLGNMHAADEATAKVAQREKDWESLIAKANSVGPTLRLANEKDFQERVKEFRATCKRAEAGGMKSYSDKIETVEDVRRQWNQQVVPGNYGNTDGQTIWFNLWQ
jgi:tetratricopeptide (TPR) repeat protein